MTFLSILIALLLERMTPQLIELRQFQWLREYTQWMADVLQIGKMGSWMAFVVLIAPLLVIIWILNGMFENALFGLFELAFNIVVIFLCLGPHDLDRQVDEYLDAIEVGDDQQRYSCADRLVSGTPSMDLPKQSIQVCKSLFVEANIRIYAALFWFVLFGPVAMVVYRLLEQWLRNERLLASLTSLRPINLLLCGWLDWIPARLTVFAYMLSGSFEDGLQAFRKGSLSAINVYEQNGEILQAVGFDSLSGTEASTQAEAMELVRKTRGLILRALVVWLLFALIITVFH